MYRVFWFVGPLLALGLIVSIVAAFHWGGDGWGHHTETVQIIGNGGTDSAGHTIDVVRVDPGDHRHWGFFPFALLGPLFVLFIFFAIFRGLFFRGRWHLFSHNQTANTGRGFHAESQDGLAFTQLADVDVGQGRQWIGNALVVGERLRYYGSGAGGIWSAVSTDGAAWAVEPGIRLNGGDPSAIIVGDGEVVLLAVGPPRADAGPAPFSGSAR